MSDSVKRIKERLSIVDVVSPYTNLGRAGKNLKGKSPFTNEKSPSFFVSPDRGMYYCFSSNKGGDIFTFIQEMEGVDFKGALKILAERAGVKLKREDPKKRSDREKRIALLEVATKFFEQGLVAYPDALSYLKQRGVTEKTVSKWRVGYAPPAWRELKNHLTKAGYTNQEIESVGLIKGDSGKEPYDVFRNRIVFPISDSAGRVVAFSGRLLGTDGAAPKYLNSPETELFNKSEILFGYHLAKQAIRKFDFSLLVEGQFDLVLAHQAGYANTVAVSGTALSLRHVELLNQLSRRVVLALDSDRAGIAAAKRAATIMLKRGMDVKIAALEVGTDPADLIQANPKTFKQAVREAKPVIEWLLKILKLGNKDERAYKLKVKEGVLPYVLLIPDLIDQDHFSTVIAEALETTKDAVRFELERLLRTVAKTEPHQASAGGNKMNFKQPRPARAENLKEYLWAMAEVLTRSPETAEAGSILSRILTEILTEPIAKDSEAQSRQGLIFELEAKLETTIQSVLLVDLADQVTELHTYIIKEQMIKLKKEMRKAETDGEEEGVKETLEALTELQKSLGDVNYSAEIFSAVGER